MQDDARTAPQIDTGVLHRRLSRFAYLWSHGMVHSIAQHVRCCSSKDTAIADVHAVMDVVTVHCENESCAIRVHATLGFPSRTSPRDSIHSWSMVARPFCALFCCCGMPYFCGASCGARLGIGGAWISPLAWQDSVACENIPITRVRFTIPEHRAWGAICNYFPGTACTNHTPDTG